VAERSALVASLVGRRLFSRRSRYVKAYVLPYRSGIPICDWTISLEFRGARVRAFGYRDQRRIGRRRQDEVLVDHEDSQRGALADAGRLCLAFTRRTMPYIPAGPLRTGIFPITERGGPHLGRVRRLLLRRFDRGRFEPGWR